MMAGVLAPCAGCSRRKHLYVQGSLNFINRSNARRNMAAKMTQSQLVKELAEAIRNKRQSRQDVCRELRRGRRARDEEERSLCASRHRSSCKGGPQSADGPQSSHRRGDQNSREKGCEVPGRKDCQGCDRPAKEEIVSKTGALKAWSKRSKATHHSQVLRHGSGVSFVVCLSSSCRHLAGWEGPSELQNAPPDSPT